MGARESVQMTKARRLVTKKGMTASAASEKAGITRSAIYMSKWYKEWKAKQSYCILNGNNQAVNKTDPRQYELPI